MRRTNYIRLNRIKLKSTQNNKNEIKNKSLIASVDGCDADSPQEKLS